MKLTCQHSLIQSPPRECGQPAAILIVTQEEFWDDGRDEWTSRLVAFPVCADHAAEEAHEAHASMSGDEFTIVNLPDPHTCQHGRLECITCNWWSIGVTS